MFGHSATLSRYLPQMLKSEERKHVVGLDGVGIVLGLKLHANIMPAEALGVEPDYFARSLYAKLRPRYRRAQANAV